MSTQRTKTSTRADAGQIITFFSGVAKIAGLPHVFVHEVLVDKAGCAVALVIGFDAAYVEALFFADDVDTTQKVYRSEMPFTIQITPDIIGRIVDGYGQDRDGLGPLIGEHVPVFRTAPGIIDRQPVTTPLTTGIKIIDAVLPIGRGQRELIIGDRKLGKTTLALDVIMNQKNATKPVVCVYVACGHKQQQLQEVTEILVQRNAFLHTVVVAATAADPYAAQYLAPFVGCAIGEYFRDNGKDALVVYDDLSQHAKAYRSVSLLLDRSPGRESYPGDIFSLHAGLLERAARLSPRRGGGSLTALPIIETEEGDITSYVPTNLISITDGQVYVDRGLFQKGFLPAVNIGLSVSRVGAQAQPPLLREVVGGIRLTLSQHKELQKLTQLETAVAADAQTKIHRGNLMLALLMQDKHVRVSWPEQVMLFYAVEHGFFDDLIEEQWAQFEKMLLHLVRTRYTAVVRDVADGTLEEHTISAIGGIVADAKREFLAE